MYKVGSIISVTKQEEKRRVEIKIKKKPFIHKGDYLQQQQKFKRTYQMLLYLKGGRILNQYIKTNHIFKNEQLEIKHFSILNQYTKTNHIF